MMAQIEATKKSGPGTDRTWFFLKVSELWATGSSTLPQFLHLHLGKASGWQE